MSEAVKEVSDSNFEHQVLQSSKPVLVDFWAPWCAPCKALTPILERIASEYADRLTVVKLNVDDHPENAKKYNVRGIPTLLIFKAGTVVGTKVGSGSESDLQTFIETNI